MNVTTRARFFSVCVILTIASCLMLCCKRVKNDHPKTSVVQLDLTSDKAVLEESWLGVILKDPVKLVTLAKSNAGWGDYFQNQLESAIQKFEVDQDTNPNSAVGLCRSTVELHQSYKLLGDITSRLNKILIQKQKLIEIDSDWIAFIDARNHQSNLNPITSQKAKINTFKGKSSSAQAWFDALFEGKAVTKDNQGIYVFNSLPEQATEDYQNKLKVDFEIKNKNFQKAARMLKRVRLDRPDFVFREGKKEVYLFDPGLIPIKSRLMISDIFENKQKNYDSYCLAKLAFHSQRFELSKKFIDQFIQNKNSLDMFSTLVISGSLNKDDLEYDLELLRQVIEQKATPIAKTKSNRVIQLIIKELKSDQYSEQFNFDRNRIIKELKDEILRIGKDMPGIQDINSLSLVERYVDQLQRLYAAALLKQDKPAHAVKMRESAEEKSKMGQISGRNTLLSLVMIASDNVSIGRLRIALKYLTRLSNDFSDARIPAELLRDLLALKALDQDGNTSMGQ